MKALKSGLLLCGILALGAGDVGAQKSKGKSTAGGIHSRDLAQAEAAATALGKNKSAKSVDTLLNGLAMGLHGEPAKA